jgi:hypothetical protein
MPDTRDGAEPRGDAHPRDAYRELELLRRIARLFDQAFPVPGTNWRFGMDALFGLVPGLGDIAGGIVAVYALRVARRVGAPGALQLRMLGNIALDAIVGTVPLVGDLFDFAYKAQTRNLALLEEWRQSPDAAARRSARGVVLVSVAAALLFVLLTGFGVWILYQLLHWLSERGAGL